jgi:uncharacterized protein
MKEIILQKLADIERTHSVTVLYACESGSRAWGFASPDSDYDVRFVYVQRPEAYLSIADKRDVIELPVNEVLDIGGWDIRKALRLFLKSNAPLYEWLQSPITYMEKTDFKKELSSLMKTYFSLRAGAHHYLSMARNTFKHDLASDQVKLKKYFYALRPLLACLWIIQKNEHPPMEFRHLRTLVADPEWQTSVDDLLERKKIAMEKDVISPVLPIHQWIESTIHSCAELSNRLLPVRHNIAELDRLFRKYIRHDL